jgi:hypothetical protein
MIDTITDRIRWFVEDVAQNIVGLDVALFFQANPNVFDSVPGLARRVGRGPEEIGPALDRMAAAEVLEVFELGAGRYRCYALRHCEEAWGLLCHLSELYLDNPPARKQIIQMIIHARKHEQQPAEDA